MEKEKNRIIALSTIDNPYNPITDFDRWYVTDLQLAIKNDRRDTCSLLAALCKNSYKLSDEENKKENEETINRIIINDPLNVYIKVVKEV